MKKIHHGGKLKNYFVTLSGVEGWNDFQSIILYPNVPVVIK